MKKIFLFSFLHLAILQIGYSGTCDITTVNKILLMDDDLRLLKVAKVTDITNSVGMNHHRPLAVCDCPPYNMMNPINCHDEWPEAGIKLVRGEIKWQDIEKEKSVYTFPSYGSSPDAIATYYASLKSIGIKPLAVLTGGNSLYSGATGTLTYANEPVDPISNIKKNYLSPTGFASFCEAVVNRYKNDVEYWELGNEPHNFDFGTYFGGTATEQYCGTYWVSHFAEYFNLAASKIKLIDRNAKILSPGDDDYTAMTAYIPLIAKNVSILAVHPYAGIPSELNSWLQGQANNPPAAITYLDPTPEGFDRMRIGGFQKLANDNNIQEIWLTEYGWIVNNNNIETGCLTSEKGQAKYLLRSMFFYPLAYNIKANFAYTWAQGDLNFYLHTTAKYSYKNINTIFNGANSIVSTEAFQNVSAKISNVQKYNQTQIEQFLLVKDSKTLFFVYWLRIQQLDSFTKQNVKIKIHFQNQCNIASVSSYDVLSSAQKTDLIFKQVGKYLVVENAQIGDYPYLVEIKLQ